MPKGFARTQSQPSIHSLSRGKGAVRHGCRNKDTPSFKHGCLQVVEQSRCRKHRQQTTTVAQRQSHQSVLKGIGIINQKFISKTDFFSKLNLYISVCRKTNIFLKWGLGHSPKAGRRDASPRIHPLSGERGQGDRDNKSEVYFKNRLFLQTVYISIITENLTQFNPFVYIAQITILKVGNNSLSFFDKKLSNHLIMREKFCIIEK